MRLVGHKGADLIVPGNTVASFRAAVEAGVDTIELDVLWLPDAELPPEQRAPLMVAHDWEAQAAGPPLPLTEALDAFLEPPLDRVEIDLDIKLPGREEEFVEALRERGLIERAMISTMEMHTLKRVLELEPNLRRGWTFPKTSRDWTRRPWAKPALKVALAGMRLQLPGLAAEKLPRFGVFAMWVYHPLVSAKLAGICHRCDVELIAWTVDDEPRMRKLIAMGVDGLVSNDPRLYARLEL
ncbi:MAG: glycerophosphodiester phosphodiesterase [Solirubrobacterales bacterium]